MEYITQKFDSTYTYEVAATNEHAVRMVKDYSFRRIKTEIKSIYLIVAKVKNKLAIVSIRFNKDHFPDKKTCREWIKNNKEKIEQWERELNTQVTSNDF
ncbi:MAG: hypothetical protein GTN53_22940 [Candidatus Aminicenantes bacterium]|nr:hypothetical protein [Candidatus Aminicenantes bacterium]NIQ69360.1 hypothetical protein [Candidatus Aminicenantes bacterium]NIT25361.1 hypothetical protein [Candidatus Aminicenantes bacterium]